MARVALVTGGSRGIGASISKALKAEGLTVAASYAGNDQAAQAFKAETGIPVFKWDVGDYDACASRASCLLAPLCRSAEASFEESLRRFTLADLEDTAVDLPNCVDPRVRALDG